MKMPWHIAVLCGSLIVGACQGTENVPSSTQPPAASPEAGISCCLAGCGEIFAASFSPEVDDETLLGSTLSVCRNSECFETTLADVDLSLAVGPDSGAGKGFIDPQQREATHGPLIAVTIWGRSTPTTPRRLSVNYLPWASNDFRDGDVYELMLKDKQGAVRVQQKTPVTYALREVCCQTCGRAILDGGTDG